MRKIIIKEGPVVFLKEVLTMEFAAILFFFAISFAENYEMLYKNFSFDDYLRYDLFIVIASALFQFFYMIFIFINWYFSYFEITESEITRKSGVIFVIRKSFSTEDITSVEMNQSLFGRFINHADIILEYKNGKKLKISNVPDFQENLHILKQFIKNGSKSSHKSILEIINLGENGQIEFKESLRFDKIKNSVNKELERSVMKTLVGFLNAEGGTLLIGVSNDGEIKGLEDDFSTLQRKNPDGFENHLTLLLKNYIGVAFVKYVDIGFEKIEGKYVCKIITRSSHKPAFLRNDDRKEDFFIRAGNSTQPLLMSEADEYIRNHFK